MAFQQPILAPSRSQLTASDARRLSHQVSSAHQAHLEKSQEWLLFPTQTPSTAYTPQTAGLSRLSDFGSLGTAARLAYDNQDDDALEDDEELDSLDEGLHAFHEPVPDQELGNVYLDSSILPTHDGLGTFPASSRPVQEHLWHFERYNPQRKSLGHQRRRSSVQRKLDALEAHDGIRMEEKRMHRIEEWRNEHSRILLEEVEKQSRQRSSPLRGSQETTTLEVSMEVSNSNIGAAFPVPEGTATANPGPGAGHLESTESAWDYIIGRLLRDFLGIDEMLLPLIFGEAVLVDGSYVPPDGSALGSNSPRRTLVLQSHPKWSLTILDCLSQELASFLHHLSYTPTGVGSLLNPVDLPYAGMPILAPDVRQSPSSSPAQPEEADEKTETTPAPIFNPTLKESPLSSTSDSGHAALWGIEEEAVEDLAQEREYWEQAPSMKTIFRLLHHHFTSRRRPLLASSTLNSSKPSNVATTSTADSLRRAAIIRKNHPLVSSQHTRRTATSSIATYGQRQHGSPNIRNMTSPLFKRSESSCASISARNARRGSGSSRNYWKLGGSIGSGSVGGIGLWAEV
ncbi:MAG: hypothetical protein Q9201_002818 [Fulgogasparrea decipioides]